MVVRATKVRPISLIKRAILSIKHDSYLNDVIFNLLTVQPINLSDLDYGYSSVLIFIYLISLLSSYISPFVDRQSDEIKKASVMIISYVIAPFIYSFPTFAFNCAVLFVVQIIGVNLIKKEKNPIFFGLFSSISVFVPVILLLTKLYSILHLSIYALGIIAVFFVQHSLDRTFGYKSERTYIIYFAVLYVAFEAFYFASYEIHYHAFSGFLIYVDSFFNKK